MRSKRGFLAFGGLCLLTVLCLQGPARAKGLASADLTKEEALKLAFPGCTVENRVIYLTEKERARAKELAGFDVGTSVVQAHLATKEGKPAGIAWFDVHKVRTKKEVLMLVVDAEQKLRRLEVVIFTEPPEYQPRASWYAQFLGKKLDDELRIGGAIKGVTGATLTAQATTRSVRRVLALHRVGVWDRANKEKRGKE